MKTTHLLTLSGLATALFAVSQGAVGQEQGRVISTTPVIQQVAVPRQVCTQEQVVTQSQHKSPAAAIVGGIAGGALGNAVGKGSGRAAATMLGVFGGVILGDRIESGQTEAQTQNVQRCTTQTFYENKATSYNVVYEFNGKQYQVQMPQDPGPFVSLQVTPVGGQPVQPVLPNPVIVRPVTQAPVITQPVTVESTTVFVDQPPVVYVRPAPVIVHAPAYAYPRPHAHSHLHPHLQPQHLAYPTVRSGHPYRQGHGGHVRHGGVVSIGFSGHFR